MLTQRFFDAVEFAGQVHADHIRKDGTGAPNLSNLLAVAGLVLEYGGN